MSNQLSCARKVYKLTKDNVDYALKGYSLFKIGGVHGGTLAEPFTVNIKGVDYTFAKDERISFYEDDTVKEGWLAEPVTVTFNGIDYTFSRKITFYEGGEVKWGSLDGRWIKFFKSGEEEKRYE